jgi:hypothetical protein
MLELDQLNKSESLFVILRTVKECPDLPSHATIPSKIINLLQYSKNVLPLLVVFCRVQLWALSRLTDVGLMGQNIFLRGGQENIFLKPANSWALSAITNPQISTKCCTFLSRNTVIKVVFDPPLPP